MAHGGGILPPSPRSRGWLALGRPADASANSGHIVQGNGRWSASFPDAAGRGRGSVRDGPFREPGHLHACLERAGGWSRDRRLLARAGWRLHAAHGVEPGPCPGPSLQRGRGPGGPGRLRHQTLRRDAGAPTPEDP
ncbi:Hypothetical protein AA314_09345 [Archangium gephyra]|uniref:Uncharacterized protein n=1 Tax=Archangium gephyra TaxID=48 RepID=A0AAC8QI20_9BACT|nr:Hypothetical protein AA314_09345 [Archangium gephyra]